MTNPFQLSLSTAVNTKKGKIYSEAEVLLLISECDQAIKSGKHETSEARELCTRAGLPMESDMPKLLRQKYTDHSFAAALTAGHSNTNHVVTWTGDYETDRIAELTRNLLARSRFQLPEAKGEDRWDKPRVAGERRRRIIRDKDMPGAPPEPPPSAYVVFVGQMTTKWRHDRPNERHHQARVVQEISKIWRFSVTEEDQKYYHDFVEEARREYKKQRMEYRATGVYTPSETIEKMEGAGLWVRKNLEQKNALEKEIAGYESVSFPLRPPEYDDEYKKRDEESKQKRKLKRQCELEEKRKNKKV
jgi:hypothetical protein